MQLRQFTEAAERARRRAMLDQVTNLRAAQFEKSTYAKYVRTLTDG